jgi:hypothetical protein
MSSRYPPRYYDDATLKVLEQVFQDVWKTMHINGAPPETEHLLRDKVTQTLLHLVDQGIRDPAELRVETVNILRR